jgi:hypothetical protein
MKGMKHPGMQVGFPRLAEWYNTTRLMHHLGQSHP